MLPFVHIEWSCPKLAISQDKRPGPVWDLTSAGMKRAGKSSRCQCQLLRGRLCQWKSSVIVGEAGKSLGTDYRVCRQPKHTDREAFHGRQRPRTYMVSAKCHSHPHRSFVMSYNVQLAPPLSPEQSNVGPRHQLHSSS